VERKPGLFVAATILIVLSANILLALNPVGSLVDLENLWLGFGLIAGSVLIGVLNHFSKKTFLKSYMYYKPREIWLMSILIFVVGFVIILYSILCSNFADRVAIEELYINLTIQIFISALMVLVMREIYTYVYEYPVRKVLKVMEKASQLIDNMRYKEALSEFENVEKKLDYYDRPHIYGWVKQSKGLCYIELAKLENKKENLLLAVKEFEEILNLRELKRQHAQVKVDIGNIYFDIAEMDNDMKYYESALDLYNDALNQYKLNKDFDGCMNAMRYAERTKTVLVLEKTF
jgi:tetratricopeptide (TPR) repeat protein